MTASASRPPNFTFSVFTCLTASLNLPSDAGESTPARQPYLFHPTADLPFRLYLSDTASLDLPSDAGESTPARQPYLFNLLRNEAHPSDTAISKPVGRRQEPPRQQPHLFLLDEAYPSDTAISKPVGRQREPTGQSNLSFPFCGRQKPTQPRCRLTARLSDHLTLPFCLNLSTRWVPISRRTPARALPVRQPSLFKSTLVDANRPTRWSWNQSDESLPARQSYLFKSHARRGLPVRHGYKQTTVGRQQEPPSQTILPSMSHARRGLPVRLGDYQSQCRREPPSQTAHLFRQLAPPFEPRRTLHTRPSTTLAFSPPPARFHHPTHEYQSHVGSRKSLPAGQPHLFLLRQRS